VLTKLHGGLTGPAHAAADAQFIRRRCIIRSAALRGRWYDWIEDLSPDEAQAAIDALNVHKGLLTVREAVEIRKLKLALQAKVEGR
jgi:hypothetical protein